VLSDLPDLAPLLRRSKVAVVPSRGGTGAPNKLLEAQPRARRSSRRRGAARALGADVDTAEDAAVSHPRSSGCWPTSSRLQRSADAFGARGARSEVVRKRWSRSCPLPRVR